MGKTHTYRTIFFMLIMTGLAFLLFFASSDVYATRSWNEAWNLGHIPLFIFIGYLIYRYFNSLQGKRLAWQFILLAGVGALLGLTIELLQSQVNRQASLIDVLMDVIGSVIAVILFSEKIHLLPVSKRYPVYFITVLLFTATTWKLVNLLYDELHAYSEFPVLADFENSRELGRLTGNAGRNISDEVHKTGINSLKVSLIKAYYSGIELAYFPRDWSAYSALVLDIYNPYQRPFTLVVSIFDRQHSSRGYSFFDRYTEKFVMHSGWNELSIPVLKLIHAPKKRQMDISDILGVRLFVVKPDQGQYFYVDAVRLEK